MFAKLFLVLLAVATGKSSGVTPGVRAAQLGAEGAVVAPSPGSTSAV